MIFDRSWYNRAGVERVMGFCTPEEVQKFLDGAPMVERGMVESGIILLKYWLEVSPQNRSAVCGIASTTGVKSGSSRRWTLSLSTAGMNIPLPATPCSPPPIPHGRRGSSPARRIKARASEYHHPSAVADPMKLYRWSL